MHDLHSNPIIGQLKCGSGQINKLWKPSEVDLVHPYRAAKDHGVPPSTLKDQLAGRVLHGSNPGPSPYLSAEEGRT